MPFQVAKFFSHIRIRELHIGDECPTVTAFNERVTEDDLGLWFEADIWYSANGYMVVLANSIRLDAFATRES